MFLNNCLMCHLSSCVDGFFSISENLFLSRSTNVFVFFTELRTLEIIFFCIELCLSLYTFYIQMSCKCHYILYFSYFNFKSPHCLPLEILFSNGVLVQNYELDKITLENNFSLADSTSKNTNHTTLEMGNALTKTVGAK